MDTFWEKIRDLRLYEHLVIDPEIPTWPGLVEVVEGYAALGRRLVSDHPPLRFYIDSLDLDMRLYVEARYGRVAWDDERPTIQLVKLGETRGDVGYDEC